MNPHPISFPRILSRKKRRMHSSARAYSFLFPPGDVYRFPQDLMYDADA